MGNTYFFNTNDLPAISAGKGASRQILGHDHELMMIKMDFETGVCGALHQHLHTQATYILSGRFEFTIDSQKEILVAGESCFMPSGIEHGCVCLEAGSLLDVFTPERDDFLNKD